MFNVFNASNQEKSVVGFWLWNLKFREGSFPALGPGQVVTLMLYKISSALTSDLM